MAPSLVLFFTLLCGQPAHGDVNVYGKPMTDCGSSHASGCTYAAMDAGAHEVCVTKLPHGFSAVTGQGSWSDQYTGQPWCICIWAYSNYILHNKDLLLKCESIPSKVLEEQYSLDKFEQCGSMSSKEGCGAEDIRRSIASLCKQCDTQAGDDRAAKSALKTKCDAILASAPAASLQRLDNEDVSVSKGLLRLQGVGAHALQVGRTTPAFGFFALAVAGVAGVMIVKVYRVYQSGNDVPSIEDPLQAAAEALE